MGSIYDQMKRIKASIVTKSAQQDNSPPRNTSGRVHADRKNKDRFNTKKWVQKQQNSIHATTNQTYLTPDGSQNTVTVVRKNSLSQSLDQNGYKNRPTAQINNMQKQYIEPVPSVSKVLSAAYERISVAASSDFKVPETWVSQGRKSTLVDADTPRVLFMGIDFGTAFTKAAIGYGGDVYAVDWTGVNSSLDMYTLPGEFSVMPRGQCYLGRAPNAHEVFGNLKIPFIENRSSERDLIRTAVFLALVMRYVRAWWYHKYPMQAGSGRLEWGVNLGAPSESWQEDQLKQRYKKTAEFAWILSQGPDDITLDHASNLARSGDFLSKDGLLSIEIIPEFVPQISTYIRSSQRQPDLHLLVDVGAGTVDVVTFNVHVTDDTNEDKFPIFRAAVEPLGTHYFMQSRFDAIEKNSIEIYDFSAVPEVDKFCEIYGGQVSDIRNADKQHAELVASLIKKVLSETWRRRYPMSPNWSKGIRVFICGGGSTVNAYIEAVQLAGQRFGTPLSVIKLPVPERLKPEEFPGDYFHRISVAFGLASNPDSLGQIVPESEVEDINPLPPAERPSFDWSG